MHYSLSICVTRSRFTANKNEPHCHISSIACYLAFLAGDYHQGFERRDYDQRSRHNVDTGRYSMFSFMFVSFDILV